MSGTDAPGELAALSAGPRWRLYAGWTAGLLALATLIGVVVHRGEVEQFVLLARHAAPEWLIPACAAQAATYLFATAVWRAVLRKAGHPRKLASLIPLGVAKLFTDQAIPSGGFSGSVLVTMALHRRRVPLNSAIAALLVGLVSYNTAYLAAALASLALLWMHGRLSSSLVAIVALLVVFSIATPALVLGLKIWNPRLRDDWLHRFRTVGATFDAFARVPTYLLKSPSLLAETVAYQSAIFLLDALTLWLALHAIGIAAEPWIPFVSFVIASTAATILPIPLGLGTFEAACVGMMASLGIPLEAALTASLLLRGMTFWLPMLPGLWITRREIVKYGDAPAPDAESRGRD